MLTRDIYPPLCCAQNYGLRIGCGDRRKFLPINFVTLDDWGTLKDIEEFYDIKIEEMPPNVEDFI